MKTVIDAAREIQDWIGSQGWRHCFIGGVALQAWGEPRQTVGADLTLLTGFGTEEEFLQALQAEYPPRYPNGLEFALRNRVYLGGTRSGIAVDVALGALPFEERTIERRQWLRLPDGAGLSVCSAEDLVVHKVFAGREIDWFDVGGVLSRQWHRLNLPQIREELRPFLALKETPEALTRFEELVELTDRRLTNALKEYGP